MSRLKSVYATTITRVFILAASLLALSGCELLSTSQTKLPLQLQNKKALYAFNVEQTIKKGRWLISEYELHQALKNARQHSFLTNFHIRHYIFEQKILADDLVKYAQESLQLGDPKTASRHFQT